MAEDQQERQKDLWSAYAAEGISSTSLKDRDQETRELRQQVQDLTGVLEACSLTQRQLSEHETRADWYSQHWKSWQDGWWHDQRWTQTPVVGSWWDDAKLSWNSWQDLDRWTAPSGYPSQKWDISESPTFPGFSANYLMWRKAVLRWKMTTDHPVEKLGTKVMNSLDWTVQAFVDARISTQETEAVLLHCHERAAHTNLGSGPGAQEGRAEESWNFLITYSSAKSSEWFPTAATVNASIFNSHGRSRNTERSSCSTAQEKTCAFAARRRVTGRVNVQRNNTTRMELLPPSSQD